MTVASCDVIVVGAGPAGAALALRLARAGCRVTLVERSRFESPRVGESLSPGVQPLLADLGVWARFVALHALPSHGTQSRWGSTKTESHSHLMTPWGSGWHVDRAAFDKLLATAAAQAGATLLLGTSVVRATGSARGWTVHASLSAVEGHSHALLLSAPVLIDATGRTTRLARSVGAHRLNFDRLVAIASELDLESDVAEGYVMVESVPDGWWYTAPLPSGRMMVMLMTDGDLCRRHNLAAQTVWEERLQRAEASLERARGRRRAGGPQVTSAVSHRLQRGERTARWLAVGDAALAVDPISGSGVCRALQSARAGADATVAMLEGDPARAIMDYEDRCDAACTTYLEERALYYGLESRWSTPFWARRAPRRAS